MHLVFRFSYYLLILSLLSSLGCNGGYFLTNGSSARVLTENPMFVQVADYDLLWDQIVDSVDTHFRVKREQRVRLIAGQLSDGRLETYPQVGSTILEPWRKDSTRGYEKWESTLQTIRRYAIVKVMPQQGGYLIEVEVYKELEDIPNKVPASRAIASLRDEGVVSFEEGNELDDPPTLGWIPLGRDQQLEQRLLEDIQARLTGLEPLPPPEQGHFKSLLKH